MRAAKATLTVATSISILFLASPFTHDAHGELAVSTVVPIVRGIEPLRVESVRVQGLRRTVRFYRPRAIADHPMLVLALHGSGGDGERLRRLTDRAFERLADENGFLLAYPDALGGQWHDCRAGAPHGAALAGLDDLSFLRAVVSEAKKLAGGPLEGVFVVGYSNGGHMAFRAALEAPGDFTAFAAIGAHLPVSEECGCFFSGTPVSIFLVSGTEDPINPWEGGEVRPPAGPLLGSVSSARATARYFRGLVGAAAEPVEKRLPDRAPNDGTWIEALRWIGGARHEVLLLVVHGGGHSLPHPTAPFPAELVGRTSRDVNGAELIWDFFARQPSMVARDAP